MKTIDLPALPEPAAAPEPEVFWRKLVGHLGRLPFAPDLLAAYYCALDPETPTRVRAVLFGAVAYFILPLDAVPDAILGLGFTDDAAVIASVIGVLGRHIKRRHYERARAKLTAIKLGSAGF